MSFVFAEIELLEVVKLCASVLLIVATIGAALVLMDWVTGRRPPPGSPGPPGPPGPP